MQRREFLTALLSSVVARPGWAEEVPLNYAESAHINGASADGKTAFILRLARYPRSGRAWVWAFAFRPDGAIFGYIDDKLQISGPQGVTAKDGDSVRYELPAVPVRMDRHGPPQEIRSVSAAATVKAHRSDNPPIGSGTAILGIEAEFRPTHASQSVQPGRTEVLGTLEATLTLPDGKIRLDGRGHWHEQSGDRPRFAPTLTYATWRGDKMSLIAMTTANGDTGFVVRGEKVERVTKFHIEPLAARRAFGVGLESGELIEGVFEPVHRYTMTIEGRARPGAIGLARTKFGSLTGMVNDWKTS